jgi:hypothetical protein
MKLNDRQLLEEAYEKVVEKSFPPDMREKITRYAELSDPDLEHTAEEELEYDDLQKWADQHGVRDHFEKHAQYSHYARSSSKGQDDHLQMRQRFMNPLRVNKDGKANKTDIQGRKTMIRDLKW